MLYDWYANDCPTSTIARVGQAGWVNCTPPNQGSPVSQIAANDLQMLNQNGFNYVHLYLWDQDLIGNGGQSTPPCADGPPPLTTVQQSPGFVSWSDPTYTPSLSGPSSSPN